jgi:hypothetical protein
MAGLLAASCRAPVVAVAAGNWAQAGNLRQQRAQRSWHQVPTVLLQAAPRQPWLRHTSALTVWVRARWTPPGRRAGSRLLVWDRLFRELGRTRGRGSRWHHATNLAAYLPQPAAYGHPEPRTTAQALCPLAVGGAASSQVRSAFAKARGGGAGGDRTHDRRIMRMPHRLARSPTCAFVAAVASALPRCARFAGFPLPRSLPADPMTDQRERRICLIVHTPVRSFQSLTVTDLHSLPYTTTSPDPSMRPRQRSRLLIPLATNRARSARRFCEMDDAVHAAPYGRSATGRSLSGALSRAKARRGLQG